MADWTQVVAMAARKPVPKPRQQGDRVPQPVEIITHGVVVAAEEEVSGL